MGATLSLRVNIDEAVGTIFENASEGTLLKAIGSDNLISKPLTTPADESSSTNEAVLSSTEDDYGMSYYYRGNVKNNFVNFSGMCWRVVRVQGNGSIKIILADRDHECNASEYSTELTSLAFISDEKFSYNSRQGSSTSDDLKYETSDIKIVLETWLNGGNYTTETKTGTFEKKIDDTKLIETEWCNDMSISRKTTDNIYYGAHDRIYETKTPTLKCNLMGLDNTSAVKINSKIGLLTADEIVFAGFGSTYDSNMSSYLIGSVMFEDDRRYWTMSPYFYNELDGEQLAAIDVTIIAHYIASEGLFVRPALVLRSDITITSGNGTKTNPYIIK